MFSLLCREYFKNIFETNIKTVFLFTTVSSIYSKRWSYCFPCCISSIIMSVHCQPTRLQKYTCLSLSWVLMASLISLAPWISKGFRYTVSLPCSRYKKDSGKPCHYHVINRWDTGVPEQCVKSKIKSSVKPCHITTMSYMFRSSLWHDYVIREVSL